MVADNGGGSFTYTPNPNFNGPDSFGYELCLSFFGIPGDCDTATVFITVTPVNDAPVAVDDTYSTNENTALNIAPPGVLTNDSDVDGDPLTAALVSNPVNGLLVLNSDGSFNYTPNANFSGADSFTYTANDGQVDSNVATVNIEVIEVNAPPDCAANASPDTLWPPNHQMVPINIVGVSDPDGDPISVIITGITQDEPENGTGDGDTSPDSEGVGTDKASVRAERAGNGDGRVYTIGFMATDGQGGVCGGEVTVNVPHNGGGNGGSQSGATSANPENGNGNANGNSNGNSNRNSPPQNSGDSSGQGNGNANGNSNGRGNGG